MSEFVSCDQKFIDEKVIVHNPDEYSIFYDSITEDALLYFTGFTFKTFGLFLDAILNFQPSVSTTPNKFLAFPDVLIMSLTKFKHNYDFLLLRAMYGLSSGSLASIFKQMAEILYEYFSQLDFWSTRKFENGSYTILFFVLRIRIYKYIIALDSNSNVIYCSDLYPNVTAHKDIILKTNVSHFLNITN